MAVRVRGRGPGKTGGGAKRLGVDWGRLEVEWAARRMAGDPITVRDFVTERLAELGTTASESHREKSTAGWLRRLRVRQEAGRAAEMGRLELDQLKQRGRILHLAEHRVEPLLRGMLRLWEDRIAQLLEQDPEERDPKALPQLSAVARLAKQYHEALVIGAGLPRVMQIKDEAASSKLAASRDEQRALQANVTRLRDFVRTRRQAQADAGRT